MHSTRFQRLHRRFGAALMPSRIAFLAVLLYLISLIPIFLFSSYCHPLADDFTYGLLVHRAVVSGGGIPEILSAAAETVRDYYFTWQGTFSAIFLFALQPGAFSESAYFLTPFIIIGCLSLSTFVLMHFVYCRLLGGKSSQAVILSALTLLLSVQMVTNQAQAFYWFNGASYYAVFYSFSLLFFAGIGTLLLDAGKKVHPVLTGCCALLAVLIGGGNYSTALTTSFIASVLCAAWLFFKKPGRFRLAVILLILLVSFAGELLNYLLPLPVPASIYGLVLMLVCLLTGIIKLDAVRDTACFLIEIMPLMFIPAAVGLMASWSVIKENLLAYLVIAVVTTVAVMAVSGLVTQGVLKRNEKGEGRK